MAAILLREAQDPFQELQALLRFMTVNLALGNTDAHAKNVSFLHHPERLMTVAPLYDIAPTRAFIDQQHVGMPINGRFRMDDIGLEELVAEAKGWRLDSLTARSVVVETIDALLGSIDDADDRFSQVPDHVRTMGVSSIRRLASTATRQV